MTLDWRSGKRAIAQEQRSIIDTGQLSSFPDCERSNANGDSDGRGTVDCADGHVCVEDVSYSGLGRLRTKKRATR
jgi:hypothetical protein